MDPITLFPPYGIDQTIHVAVLIGVLLLLGLTEWFGWVFSGLVVPGYLASVFILEPASATAVLIQAVLTFLLARLLSSLASRSGAWNAFFGRERFLLLVFCSIVVRQASAMWLFPDTLRVFDEIFGTTYRFELSLSSVGLVLVPLTANMFWKLDLRRGLFQVGVPTVLTYVLLAYVLLPYTNLSFSRLELTYENVALDFLSSPKAYILLLVGAYLASRYNLLYGWDYAGVLVPALIGLGWVAPHRLVTTLAETMLLVVCVRVLLHAPGLRTMNLEGPRKVAVVFAISFMMKWTIGWFAGPSFMGLPVTDLFGLGYLLSSLLAVKILQKDTTPRIIVPTFIVSIATFAIGSALGFGLDKVAPAPPPLVALAPATAASPPTTMLARTATGVLALAHVRARLDRGGELPLVPAQLPQYRALWQAIDAWLAGGPRADVERLAKPLGLALASIEPVRGRAAWALVETEERLAAHVGWDTAVLVPGAPGPTISIPSPGREAPSAEAAAVLCERVQCRAAIASGVDTLDRRQPAHAIARRAIRGSAFEVRVDASLARGHVVFHVANEAPDVNVSELWTKPIELSWVKTGDLSTLRANPRDMWQIVVERAPAIEIVGGLSIEAWYARRFTEATRPLDVEPTAPITGAPPSQSELRFLEVVVAPAALAKDLDRANAMARLVGYSVDVLADGLGPGKAVWLLGEPEPRALGWGVLAGRVDQGEPLAVEAPRPRREAGTGRIAVELFRHSRASVLVLADGATPPERVDADPAAPWNTGTAFQAFHQAVHDAWRALAGTTILQIRGFGAAQPVKEPAVLVFARTQQRSDTAPGPVTDLFGEVRIDDGGRDLVDLAGTGNPQLTYCARFERIACALLWFSETARDAYRGADRERELARLGRMGIRTTQASATAALLDRIVAAPEDERLAARFGELAAIAEEYASSRNVHLLRRLPPAAVRAGFSDELGRPFLLIEAIAGDRIVRGLVPLPGGGDPANAEALHRQVGETLADELPALLARRPKIITVAGRLEAP